MEITKCLTCNNAETEWPAGQPYPNDASFNAHTHAHANPAHIVETGDDKALIERAKSKPSRKPAA